MIYSIKRRKKHTSLVKRGMLKYDSRQDAQDVLKNMKSYNLTVNECVLYVDVY